MKIAIIIPVYNAEEYILQCLQSVYNQTYKNIEVLIINDCSTDNTIPLINTFIEKINDSRFRVINHSKNKGVSAARNTGIKTATADYLYFLDSDDYISEDCIESFITLMMKYNHPDIIIGSAKTVPPKWNLVSIDINTINVPDVIENKKQINKYFYKHKYIPVVPWNKMISRNFLLKNDLYFLEGIVYEDMLWSYYISKKLNKVAFNKKYTYFYTNNPHSIVHKYGDKEKKSGIIIIKNILKQIDLFNFHEIPFVLHTAHTFYCQRYGVITPTIWRYINVILYLIKCIILPVEKLSK